MRKLRMFLPAVALVCAIPGLTRAQDTHGGSAQPWKAAWITMAGAPARDEVVLHFRKTIDLSAVPQSFAVDVSADNQFVFFVNGQRVGTGPAKSDLAHWRYETYDLAPYLHPGKNVLSATVWDFGIHTAISQMSDRVGFLVHGETDAERQADTNDTWQVEQEKGIAPLPADVPGFYFAAGPGELWDFTEMDANFLLADTTGNGSWSKAVTLGRGALRGERDAPNNWQLVKDPLPPMEMKEMPPPTIVRATGIALTIPPAEHKPGLGPTASSAPKPGIAFTPLVIPANSKVTLLLDQHKLFAGYPALTVAGGAQSKIRLTYAEALYDDNRQKGNRNDISGKHILGVADEFISDGSQNREFMPLNWRTWRYLQIDVETGNQPLTIGPLKTWFSAFPFEERAYFRSDDQLLKKIWDISWRTARLDAHDTYMDTPYWERLQYIGDTRIQALISYAVAGDDRLARQAIDAFNNSRIPDGLTQSRYPSSLVQMIPTFSLMWVGMVHDFWMYREDSEFVKAQLPGVRTVLGWYLARQRADGLLNKIPWWPFVDWGKDFEDGVPPQDPDGGSSVITLQFVEALRYAADLEEQFGDSHQAEIDRAASDRAAAGITKLCWNKEWGLLADTPAQKHFSQHANILGVWLDVIPKEQQADVIGRILTRSERHFASTRSVPEMTLATYYFRYYLARAVEHSGMGNWYLQLLAPWQDMVKLGLTTWAENPEPTRSDSHAWSAHPNFDLLRIIAGIQPASSGFATVRIEPHLLNLPPHIEAGMPTPKGMLEVKYTTGAQGLQADLTLPPSMTGNFIYNGQTISLHPGPQILQLNK